MWDFRDKPAGQENEKAGREQMMKKNNKTGKRLRLTPLILGGYAAFLGFGLIVIGLAEMKEVIGIVRLLIGIGMAGFGLLGIWDGVRDLVRPDKKRSRHQTASLSLRTHPETGRPMLRRRFYKNRWKA